MVGTGFSTKSDNPSTGSTSIETPPTSFPPEEGPRPIFFLDGGELAFASGGGVQGFERYERCSVLPQTEQRFAVPEPPGFFPA